MNSFDDMLAFIRVVEARSFTAAAARLNVSKSVVSRRLGALENRLGARLLNRTTRTLSLTEVGQAFYERARRIVADVAEAEQAVASLSAEPRGNLRVAAPVSFGVEHLAPAVAEFLRRFPAVEIEMDLNDRVVDLVHEGYDLAVRIGRLRDSSLVARKLAPLRRVLCASPDYLARMGVPRTPEDLVRHNCLVYTNVPASEDWQFTVPDGDGGERLVRAVRVSGSLRADNGDLLREAAIAGVGITIMPTFIVGDAIRAGRLAVVPLDCEVPDAAIHAVYPANRHLSPKVRAFVDFLAGRFAPVPAWDAALAPAGGG